MQSLFVTEDSPFVLPLLTFPRLLPKITVSDTLWRMKSTLSQCKGWLVLGACFLGTQCSLVSTTSKSARAGRVLAGETLYWNRSADPAHDVTAQAAPSLEQASSAQPNPEQPRMTTAATETPSPPPVQKATPAPIEKSITTRKRLLYAEPEGAGRLRVQFAGGELELGLSSLVAFVGRSETALTHQLKMASLDEKTVFTRFVGGRDGEACVMSSIQLEGGRFARVKEGLYYTIWEYLDSEGGLAACRMDADSGTPKVDIARFKRRYPNDQGLYDDGQALLVDGKVVAARIIGHACRE